MNLLNKASIAIAFLFSSFIGCAQQQVDDDFVPVINKPLFKQGEGPVMLVDGGHHNFHTLDDKFAPFGKIATMDGFRVRDIPGKIDSNALKGARILVIANALHEKNVDSWRLQVYAAFTEDEVKLINSWVKDGGRLFLIADHMPFPGAVADLAQSMGFTLYNGFALQGPDRKFDIFSFSNNMLQHNVLTDSLHALDSLVSFTGQAFKIPDNATSVITFDASYKVLMPEVAWKFSKDMEMIPAKELSQLAYCRYGSGKIVVGGEAAMFTAQKAGNIKFGLNASFAKYNLPLLLNIFKWLNE